MTSSVLAGSKMSDPFLSGNGQADSTGKIQAD
jgi:hypothetical protein